MKIQVTVGAGFIASSSLGLNVKPIFDGSDRGRLTAFASIIRKLEKGWIGVQK